MVDLKRLEERSEPGTKAGANIGTRKPVESLRKDRKGKKTNSNGTQNEDGQHVQTENKEGDVQEKGHTAVEKKVTGSRAIRMCPTLGPEEENGVEDIVVAGYQCLTGVGSRDRECVVGGWPGQVVGTGELVVGGSLAYHGSLALLLHRSPMGSSTYAS